MKSLRQETGLKMGGGRRRRAREKSRPKGSSGHGWQCRWEQRCCVPQGQQCVRGEGSPGDHIHTPLASSIVPSGYTDDAHESMVMMALGGARKFQVLSGLGICAETR